MGTIFLYSCMVPMVYVGTRVSNFVVEEKYVGSTMNC